MKLIAQSLLRDLADKAGTSPRSRAHHNVHMDANDAVQRFFVVANRDSYFRPHRHATKAEMAILLEGAVDVLTFDDAGRIVARYAVGEGTASLGYETPQGTWHTLLPRADGTAFLEVKQGPYDPATASEFAPWAPAEGDVHVPQYLAWLRSAQPQDVFPG